MEFRAQNYDYHRRKLSWPERVKRERLLRTLFIVASLALIGCVVYRAIFH